MLKRLSHLVFVPLQLKAEIAADMAVNFPQIYAYATRDSQQ